MYAERTRRGTNVATATSSPQSTRPRRPSLRLHSKSVLSSRIADSSANRPVSRNPNVLYFNFSGIDIEEYEIVELLYKQYPEACKLFPTHRKGFYELTFEPGIDVEQVAKRDLTYKNHSIPVSTTFKPLENSLLVTLINIPVLSEEPLANLLETELLKYGELLDLRLTYYPNTTFLSPKALAFYDLSESPEVANKLPKSIIFDTISSSPMYLSWKGAPPQCSNCKAMDHIRAKCPKLHPHST